MLTIWANHVVEDYKPPNFNLYDEDVQYPVSIRLQFECINNTTEYDLCIISLEATLELKVGKSAIRIGIYAFVRTSCIPPYNQNFYGCNPLHGIEEDLVAIERRSE